MSPSNSQSSLRVSQETTPHQTLYDLPVDIQSYIQKKCPRCMTRKPFGDSVYNLCSRCSSPLVVSFHLAGFESALSAYYRPTLQIHTLIGAIFHPAVVGFFESQILHTLAQEFRYDDFPVLQRDVDRFTRLYPELQQGLNKARTMITDLEGRFQNNLFSQTNPLQDALRDYTEVYSYYNKAALEDRPKYAPELNRILRHVQDLRKGFSNDELAPFFTRLDQLAAQLKSHRTTASTSATLSLSMITSFRQQKECKYLLAGLRHFFEISRSAVISSPSPSSKEVSSP